MTNIITSDDVLLYAFRYSLTRRSNAPAVVMDSIIHNIENISTTNIEKIIEEIKLNAGSSINSYEDSWNGLSNDLQFELKVRQLVKPKQHHGTPSKV